MAGFDFPSWAAQSFKLRVFFFFAEKAKTILFIISYKRGGDELKQAPNNNGGECSIPGDVSAAFCQKQNKFSRSAAGTEI